jgi:hypothetical protein
MSARMRKTGLSISQLLRQLESFYGKQEPCWPTDPYLFLVWWHCGYPASDAACAQGWESLNRKIGVEPRQLLAATPTDLASALKPGGMVPELRATRLKDIAARVEDEFGVTSGRLWVGPSRRCAKHSSSFQALRIQVPIAYCSSRALRRYLPFLPTARMWSSGYYTGRNARTTAQHTARHSKQSRRGFPRSSMLAPEPICY